MKNRNNPAGFLTVIALLSITGFLSLNLYFQQRTARDKLDIRVFPYVIGDWQGKDLEITEQEYQILETRNLISREYLHPGGEKLYLFIIYSETNRAVFHPPEVCLIGSGVKIVDKKSEVINDGSRRFSVNMVYTEKDDFRGIALFCYKAADLYTDNFYRQQLHFTFNQLLGRHKGGATIRVFAPIPIEKNEEASLAALKSFFIQAKKALDALSI
jgi:EpsI family protein